MYVESVLKASPIPATPLAFRALEGDAGLPIVLNAANEVAVARFLAGELSFPGIGDLIRRAMDEYEREGIRRVDSLDDVRDIDRWGRGFAARETGAVKSN